MASRALLSFLSQRGKALIKPLIAMDLAYLHIYVSCLVSQSTVEPRTYWTILQQTIRTDLILNTNYIPWGTPLLY
jgi:hypothetical protein